MDKGEADTENNYDENNYDGESEGPLFDYVPAEEVRNQLCDKKTVARVGSITIPLFFSIVVLLSLFGNILVLVILGLYETLRSLTNIFIFNLAVSDLMFTLGLPFWSSYYIWGWTFGDAMCKGVNFIFSIGYYSSIVFLLLMTIQRYLAVVHRLSDWEKGRWFSFFLILGAWAVSIAAALPAVLFSEVVPDPENPTLLYCEYNSRNVTLAVTYERNILFLLGFSVIGLCYLRILQTVLKSRRRRHRTVRLIFCIVAVFFICWTPYNIVIFLQTLTDHGIEPFTDCDVSDNLEYWFYVFRLLANSHCSLNPVFYVFIGVKFRNHLRMFVQKYFQSESNMEPKQPRIAAIQGSQGSLY